MAHGGKAQGSLQITLQIADLKMRIARLNAKVTTAGNVLKAELKEPESFASTAAALFGLGPGSVDSTPRSSSTPLECARRIGEQGEAKLGSGSRATLCA